MYLSLSWAEGFSILKRISQLGSWSFRNMKKKWVPLKLQVILCKAFPTCCGYQCLQHLILDTWPVPEAVINAALISVNRTLSLMPSGESRMKTIQQTYESVLEADSRMWAWLCMSSRTAWSHIPCPSNTLCDSHVRGVRARAEPSSKQIWPQTLNKHTKLANNSKKKKSKIRKQ